MEMKVNSTLVKSEREKRAWSQEHLASVTGLGMRTIQRIEISGTASNESLKALASVFELDLVDLRVISSPITKIGPKKARMGAIATLIALSVAFIIANPILANDVLLDLDIAVEQQVEEQLSKTNQRSQEIVGDNETTTILLTELLKLEITPSVQDTNEIMLAVKVYEFHDGEYSLRPHQPKEIKVTTSNNQEAIIQSNSDTGRIRILLTPTIQ